MLQVFYLYVSYVAMTIHVCCKCMFQMFLLIQTYVVSVLCGCCICCSSYTHMLQADVQMFHLFQTYVAASVFISRRNMFHAFQMFVSYVSSECCMNVDLVPINMHVHGRATQKRSKGMERIETCSSKHGLACVRAAPCGGERRASKRTVAAACGTSEAGGDRCNMRSDSSGMWGGQTWASGWGPPNNKQDQVCFSSQLSKWRTAPHCGHKPNQTANKTKVCSSSRQFEYLNLLLVTLMVYWSM